MSKYPPLYGICKTALEKNLCNGCNKLEMSSFTGQAKCELIERKQEKYGVQEKIKLWINMETRK